MSAAIKGHGRRDEVIPWCKCGWRGKPASPDAADAQYESHKASVRKKLGIPEHRPLNSPQRTRPKLELVR